MAAEPPPPDAWAIRAALARLTPTERDAIAELVAGLAHDWYVRRGAVGEGDPRNLRSTPARYHRPGP